LLEKLLTLGDNFMQSALSGYSIREANLYPPKISNRLSVIFGLNALLVMKK